jgi:putative salt-induced outer membrane protein YdiY
MVAAKLDTEARFMRFRGWFAALLGCWFAWNAQGQEAAPPAPANPPPAPLALAPVPPEEMPFYEWLMPERKYWTGGVELGVTGADGNSNNFNLRFATNAKYENERNLFKTDLLYTYANANGADTQNRAIWRGRYERLQPNSPWSHFLNTEAEHDEFANFDLRLSAHLGCGYMFIKNERTMLKGRFGAGGSQKFGGPDTAFRPELDAGVDFEHKINDRSKISGTIDYYPSLLALDTYRMESRAAYEVLIDPTYNLTFKTGLVDRYDSQPAGKRPNDITYFATILWKF